MKSIQDVRRQNLNDLIDREFNGVQTRMAEKLGTQANLVNRWALGKKVIGDQVARKIEAAANKPRNWLDIDRFTRTTPRLSTMTARATHCYLKQRRQRSKVTLNLSSTRTKKTNNKIIFFSK